MCWCLSIIELKNARWNIELLLISIHFTNWRWPKFVAETCSCDLHIVNSIPPNLLLVFDDIHIHLIVWFFRHTTRMAHLKIRPILLLSETFSFPAQCWQYSIHEFPRPLLQVGAASSRFGQIIAVSSDHYCRPAFLKLWSSGSALVVLLDWTLVQKRQKK